MQNSKENLPSNPPFFASQFNDKVLSSYLSEMTWLLIVLPIKFQILKVILKLERQYRTELQITH